MRHNFSRLCPNHLPLDETSRNKSSCHATEYDKASIIEFASLFHAMEYNNAFIAE
jgi:hypothetical protein